MMTKSLLTVLAMGLVLSVPGLANAQFSFTTIDVPGSTATFCGGNSAHAIAGWYIDAGYKAHGFLLTNGVFTSIDVPGAVGPNGTSVSGIAANGLLTGSWDDGSGIDDDHPRLQAFFRSKKGAVTTLAPPGSIRSEGSGLNAQGQVVGFYRDPVSKRHAFTWDKGHYTTFNVPGDHHLGGTGAFGINDRGQVIGWYHEEDGQLLPTNRHGFLLSKGVITTIDPPVPEPAYAAATGINNAGQIVGYYFDAIPPFQGHGFFLSGGIYTLINVPGAFDTFVGSINAQGEIVGTYDVDVDSDDVGDEYHCFVGTPVR